MAGWTCPDLLAGKACSCSQCTAMNVQQICSGASNLTHRPQTLTISLGEGRGANSSMGPGSKLSHYSQDKAPSSTKRTMFAGQHTDYAPRTTHKQPVPPAGSARNHQMREFLGNAEGRETLPARKLRVEQAVRHASLPLATGHETISPAHPVGSGDKRARDPNSDGRGSRIHDCKAFCDLANDKKDNRNGGT